MKDLFEVDLQQRGMLVGNGALSMDKNNETGGSDQTLQNRNLLEVFSGWG